MARTPVPSASFPVEYGGLVWGRGRATPVPTCGAHTHVWNWLSGRACRAGAGPREWLWFHLPPAGGCRLTTVSGLARRQPLGLYPVAGDHGRSNWLHLRRWKRSHRRCCDCNARHRFVKAPKRDRNMDLRLTCDVVVGALPWHTVESIATRSQLARARVAEGIRFSGRHPRRRHAAAGQRTADPDRPPSRAPPSPREPCSRGGASPAARTAPARSEETPRT